MDTLRWGIAGPGRIASQFAECMELLDDDVIVSVASRSAERAEAFGERFGVSTRHRDYEALAADPTVDVVYVATPHARHESDTVLFLEAGKHVLCEKPFALNARQARHMADAARANDRFLMEAMWSRFLPAYRKVASVVEDGTIGAPLLVQADFGFRAPVMPDHRLFDLRLGGGALLDVGIYPVQLCAFVLGNEIENVVADASIGTTGVDEHVAAVLHHANGGLGVIAASIRANTGCTARVTGEEGWIELPSRMHHAPAVTVGTTAGSETFDATFPGGGLQFQAMEVHECIEQGRTESTTMPLADTIAIAGMLDAIRERVGIRYPDE